MQTKLHGRPFVGHMYTCSKRASLVEFNTPDFITATASNYGVRLKWVNTS